MVSLSSSRDLESLAVDPPATTVLALVIVGPGIVEKDVSVTYVKRSR